MNSNATTSAMPLISVVDDDTSMRTSTRRLLSSFGFMAEAFASAGEFLDSQRGADTACLILDVRLPDMDGLELQRHLTKRSRNRIPIIFVAAQASEHEQRRAMEAGAVNFLRKPVDEQALLHAIEKALRRDPYLRPGYCESALND